MKVSGFVSVHHFWIHIESSFVGLTGEDKWLEHGRYTLPFVLGILLGISHTIRLGSALNAKFII